ncbi:MAG: hypothetical protein Q7T82_05850, partial [Armatimonadota bacterium]|nr:hypothetical protein [Armatimonadota bacterium]
MKRLSYLLLLAALATCVCAPIEAVPGAPTIIWPTIGAVVESNVPDITWSSGAYTAYQVRIGTTDDPNNGNGWDSGTVWVSGSTGGSAMSGYLTPQTTYYVFVRLYDASGWGPWSAYGNSFYVNGQFLNDPYLIAGGGLQWWDYVCYNPDRNEYCITWQNGYVIHWRRLDSTGANIGSEMVLSDNSSGHHFSVVCYN